MAMSRRRMLAESIKKLDYENMDPLLRDRIYWDLQTPAGFAYLASEGLWKPARHLEYISNLLVQVAHGKIKRLILNLAPRHGKSSIVQYFVAWYLGFWQDRSILYTTYAADFAAKIGREIRDIVKTGGKKYFHLEIEEETDAAFRWNLVGQKSSFYACGMRGPVMGRGANIFIIDDPVKEQKEAFSQTFQEANFEWYKATAVGRLEPNASVILIQHRWSHEDLAGKLISEMESGGDVWTVVNLPAIALENDLLGRQPGEALWPEKWPIEELMIKKRSTDARWWAALYQQSPVPDSGGMFLPEWFADRPGGPFVDSLPNEGDVIARVRGWDQAATFQAGCYTTGVRMSKTRDGFVYIEDVVRQQLDVGRRDRMIQFTAGRDDQECRHRKATQIVEQEPGSAGITAAAHFGRILAGFSVGSHKVTGDKETRAQPYASQWAMGNIRILRRPWNKAFIDEHLTFPEGYKDQVDGASLAYHMLTLGGGGGFGSGSPVPITPIKHGPANLYDMKTVRNLYGG